jgi:hypothetical protein
MSQLDLSNVSSIPTPSSGKTSVYVDSVDKHLKIKDDAGAVTDLVATASSITGLTGEVTATGPGLASATVANSAVIAKTLTGFTPTSGVVLATDSILQAIQKLANRQSLSWFGDGRDSDVTLTSNTTLVRDMYYNNLTINSGVTLFTGGFRIICLGNLENNGIIDRNGSNAIGATGGVALVVGTVSACVGGGAGGTTSAGTAGTASANSVGGTAGAGGASVTAGGAGGALTVVTTNNGSVDILATSCKAIIARDLANTVITGGAGAGGGGGAGAGLAGGGGGGGGGIIVISARNIFGTGIIRANGGNGADAVGANAGGGGAGGGGAIAVISENDIDSTSLTLQVNAGVNGTGNGTGANGNAGTVGRIYKLRS